MNYPDKSYLDADIIMYRAAFWADENGIEDLEDKLARDISCWTPQDTFSTLCFSCSRSNNFRRKVYPEYKLHREGTYQPDSLNITKDILMTNYYSIEKENVEADDLLGIAASSGAAVAVTIDKDLRGTNGWHWNPDKEFVPVYISENVADWVFCTQWLTGDSTDNLKGIPRIGPKKANKILEGVLPEYLEEAVCASYEKKGLSEEYCLQQARCVRILRQDEYFNGEVKLFTPRFLS
jgi:hypothetical protein